MFILSIFLTIEILFILLTYPNFNPMNLFLFHKYISCFCFFNAFTYLVVIVSKIKKFLNQLIISIVLLFFLITYD